MYDACDVFAMENLLCIAEGRRLKYKAEDTPHMRYGMVTFREQRLCCRHHRRRGTSSFSVECRGFPDMTIV